MLVILELALPELCGAELLRRLKSSSADILTLVYSGTLCEERIREALREEPEGFVHKDDSLGTLLEAVKTVARGGVYISARIAPFRKTKILGAEKDTLSTREREILQLIAESHSSKEIGVRLDLSRKTVENHRAHIMAKLNVHDTAALTRIAVRCGLVAI